MKLNKLATLSALSLAFAGIAQAQTTNYIYLTGSTAFRATTYDTIVACFDSTPDIAAWKASTVWPSELAQAQTAGYMNFYGNVGGNYTIVKCAWSGSEAGILDLTTCASKTEAFMADSIATGTYTATPATTDNHAVDIAMADNSQAFSKNKTPAISVVSTNGAGVAAPVGIVPFVWAKNAQYTPYPTDWAAITNITCAQIRAALAGGIKVAQLITDDTNTKWAYVAGRDNNSGTRVNALLDCGLATSYAVKQTIITGSDGAPVNSALTSSGQSSGGTLAGTMGYRGSATATDKVNGGTGWYALAYLGLADYYTASVANSGDGAVALSFNGVTESTSAVEEGTYSFWGQEYMFLSNCDSITGAAGQFFAAMCAQFPSHVSNDYEISLSGMHCTKASPAADPVHN